MGKMTANREPAMLCVMPRLLTRESRGTRMTCLGRAMAQTKRLKITPRPQKRFLAKTYPAREAVIQVRSMATTEMNTLLNSQRRAMGNFMPKSSV